MLFKANTNKSAAPIARALGARDQLNSLFLFVDFGKSKNAPATPIAIDAAQITADTILEGGRPNGSLSSASFVPAGSIRAKKPEKRNAVAVTTVMRPKVTLRIFIFGFHRTTQAQRPSPRGSSIAIWMRMGGFAGAHGEATSSSALQYLVPSQLNSLTLRVAIGRGDAVEKGGERVGIGVLGKLPEHIWWNVADGMARAATEKRRSA